MIVTSVLFLLFFSCVITAPPIEGDTCIMQATNEKGQCMIVHECEVAKKLIKENKDPEFCGFAETIPLPLVCCPVRQKLISPRFGQPSGKGETCRLQTTNDEGRCLQLSQCEDGKKLLRENKMPQTCGFSGTTPLVCCPVKQQSIEPNPENLSHENKPCRLQTTNDEGRCIQLPQCEDAQKLIRENKRPRTCGSVGTIPLVCCPVKQPLIAPKPGKLSQENCKKYFDENQDIPVTVDVKAVVKEFPHMAAVGYGNSKADIIWLCGGTLISHYFVLSAAHCVDSEVYGRAKWIRLGDLDLERTNEGANPVDVAIRKTYVHPQYKSSSHYHDIALFKLEKYVSFWFQFKAACLQSETNLPTNDLQATGWDKLSNLGETSSHLMKVNLHIVEHQTCSRRYADAVERRQLKNGILEETQICAGNAEGGDTCPGDSGGPLHYMVGKTGETMSHFVVAGITSFGDGCGGEDSAAVYTRISAYVGWIENIVWRENSEYLRNSEYVL